ELLIVASPSIGYLFMSADAPHGTTSEYSTCSAESVSRITIVKLSISNHVIVVIILGKSNYECIAILKPDGISSKSTDIIFVLVCWKRVYSSKLTHKCWCTYLIISKA